VGWTFGRLPKKNLLLPTVAFPGIESPAEGKGLRRSDVEGIERSAEVFFSLFRMWLVSRFGNRAFFLYRIDEELGD